MEEINLSEILKSPEDYLHIENVAVMFTNSPINDLRKGWSYVYSYSKPNKDSLKVMTRELNLNTLDQMDGILFDIDEIMRRVKRSEAYSKGEEVLIRLFMEDKFDMPLHLIRSVLEPEDWKALYAELLTRFENETRTRIRYSKEHKGWFLTERGLISCFGDNLVEAICKLEKNQNLLGSYDKFRYILGFHPKALHKPSAHWDPKKIVAAEPDLNREFYLIIIDTTLDFEC